MAVHVGDELHDQLPRNVARPSTDAMFESKICVSLISAETSQR